MLTGYLDRRMPRVGLIRLAVVGWLNQEEAAALSGQSIGTGPYNHQSLGCQDLRGWHKLISIESLLEGQNGGQDRIQRGSWIEEHR